MPRTLLAAVLACSLCAIPAPAAHATDAGVEMMRAINSYRAAHGVPPLARARTLERSAQRYARRLLRRGRIVHMGIAPSRRFRRVGENLEAHRGRRVSVEHVLRAWANSPPHRSLLLSRDYRWGGARPARGLMRGRPAVVWVLHVGGR